MRLVIAECTVDYEGRLTARLERAVRLIMVKADGCVAIHADGGAYKPLNWMNAPNTLAIEDGQWRVSNPKDEQLTITLHEVLADTSHDFGQDPGLVKDGVEAHLQELLAEQASEVQLREEYRKKLVQAVNLDALKKQLVQVQQYVTQLEKQLPSKAEMDALLSDINQAGLGRSLQFELFRPGEVSVKEYYAELPIAVRVTGGYHDIGLFAADIANLSRIVTLNNLSLAPVKDRDGVLTMDGVAKTFRYLDQEEIEMQQKAAKDKAAGAKGAKP